MTAVIYARYSSDNQREESIEGQIRECTAYAEKNGITVVTENPYFNAMQVKFAYAVTCHKAQGGQWRCVFVDKMLFGDEQISRDLLRWLYTAITRATEKLYFINFDERFFDGK